MAGKENIKPGKVQAGSAWADIELGLRDGRGEIGSGRLSDELDWVRFGSTNGSALRVAFPF